MTKNEPQHSNSGTFFPTCENRPLPSRCTHGYTYNSATNVGPDGRTACCGAYTSIFTDDGTEYCKCCYGSAIGRSA